MGALDDLMVLADRPRCAEQKWDMKTRLAEKTEKDASFDQRWKACCKTVDRRDGPICRCCKRRVVPTLELQSDRREHHHIVRRRKAAALMTDPRNVLVVCMECHEKITHNKLHIVGPAKTMFEVDGKRYLNAADKKLLFLEKKAA